MRVYLPSSDIDAVPRMLSDLHLRQQGRHGLAILLNLSLNERLQRRIRYSNSPPIQMWEYWLPFLLRHVEAVAREINRRGIVNRTLHNRLQVAREHLDKIREKPVERPTWCDFPRMFESHRAMLRYAGGRWYKQFSWLEPPAPVPIWPALLPEVGETMMDPNGGIWTVGEVSGHTIHCMRSDEDRVTVPTLDVYSRRWQRVIEE